MLKKLVKLLNQQIKTLQTHMGGGIPKAGQISFLLEIRWSKTLIFVSYQENVLASLNFQAKEQRKLPIYEVKNINIHDQPTHVIIHARTNNLATYTREQCIKNIKGLRVSVKQRFPNAKLGVSSIILRKDILMYRE